MIAFDMFAKQLFYIGSRDFIFTSVFLCAFFRSFLLSCLFTFFKQQSSNLISCLFLNKWFFEFVVVMDIMNTMVLQTTTTQFVNEHSSTQPNWPKWWSVRLRTNRLWVRIPLQSLKLQVSRLFRARSSLAFKQLQSVDLLRNAYVT